MILFVSASLLLLNNSSEAATITHDKLLPELAKLTHNISPFSDGEFDTVEEVDLKKFSIFTKYIPKHKGTEAYDCDDVVRGFRHMLSNIQKSKRPLTVFTAYVKLEPQDDGWLGLEVEGNESHAMILIRMTDGSYVFFEPQSGLWEKIDENSPRIRFILV